MIKSAEDIALPKILTPEEIGKNLRAVYLDGKNSEPAKWTSITTFGKRLKRTRQMMDNYLGGKFDKLPSDLLTSLALMGYSSEWVIHRTGKMKATQKDSLGFTATVLLRTEHETQKQKLSRTDARLNHLEKELADAKREIAELKSILQTRTRG